MKTPDDIKREKRMVRKINRKSKNIIPLIVKSINNIIKPLTVKNKVTRRIYVAHQPIDVITNYLLIK